MYIYINGNYCLANEAVISPFDHGFLYGVGLFETFAIYNGHPFLLDDHLVRLNNSCDELQIGVQFSREQVLDILRKLSEYNRFDNAYVRFNVSAGNGEIGLQTKPYEEPNIIVFMKPLIVEDSYKEKELKLIKVRRNTPEGTLRYKSHHYLNNILGKREVGNDPLVEGLFLTENEYVAEGIVSNVFFIKDKMIYTPSIETGILNGITRMFVITLAKQLGFFVKEGFFTVEEIQVSDEIFLTNSIQEIVAVHQFGYKQLPGKEGVITKQLIAQYRTYREKLWSKQELKKG